MEKILQLSAADFSLKKLIEENRGNKRQLELNLVRKANGEWMKIPILLVSGTEPGNILLADGCCHGDEYEGTEGIIETWRNLGPESIKGAFVGIPALNLDAYGSMNRYSGNDFVPVDLNRAFPGNEQGYVTDYLANYYLEHFIKEASAVVTLHGGGNTLFLSPVVCFPDTGTEVSRKAKEMAEAFGFDFLWHDEDIDPAFGLMDQHAYLNGIPVVTAEIGGQCIRHREREECIQRIQRGILNVIKVLEILGDPVQSFEQPCSVHLKYIYSTHGGIHKPQKRDKERVKKGETLSIITDVFGNEVERIKAPYDGIVVGYLVYSIVNPKSWVYLMGTEVKK
ncbi:MAG: hypothetical protein HFE76_02140 [Firmicutes bacterium]|nr:hypothetical protein [Bacillota bacterium]